jgi:cell division protein FtsI/penicillin-binding protein 2
MSKGFASTYRIFLLATGLLGVFGILGARLVWLHVIDRDSLLKNIVKMRRQVIVEKARRGDILDANDAILATSHSLLVVGVDPSAVRKPDDRLHVKDEAKWPQLAALLGIPLPQLEQAFTTKFREPAPAAPTSPATVAAATSPANAPAGLVFNFALPSATPPPAAAAEDDEDAALDDSPDEGGRREIHWTKLAENVSESTYREIQKLGIQGVTGDRVYRRTYPHGQLASHLLGFVNRQERPVAGLERYADFYLRGQDGWREGERDGRSRELAQFRTRDVPRADGYSVKVSIDTNVQDIVEQELERIARTYQPLKATIVVSDPRTGFILGLGNYPTFDPNEYNKVPKDEMERLRNVAVADVYEPGSVFKIVAAAGALEEHLVTPDTTFDVSLTRIDYRGISRSLPAEDHVYEDPRHVPLTRVLSFSSNRGAAQLAMKLGEEKFYDYARAFGFGSKLGFPVGGEVGGTVHEPGKPGWDNLTITRMPMGHSVDCTVLQMHTAMSAIANDGVLLRPQIIREIRDATNEVVYRFDRVELHRVVSVETARTVAQLLMGVATKDGTAPEAAIAGYDVAGKTGTTQKLEEVTLADGTKKLVYSNRHHVASFVGFFPALPRPGEKQVAISVIVDDADAHAPNGKAYGKTVAAPSFKRIGEQLIPVLNLQPARPAFSSNLVAFEGGRR